MVALPDRPMRTVTHPLEGGQSNSKSLCGFAVGHPGVVQGFYLIDGDENSQGVGLTYLAHQNVPLMQFVFGSGDPFQVLDVVVCRISIFVVAIQVPRTWTYECLKNDVMDCLSSDDSVSAKGDSPIAKPQPFGIQNLGGLRAKGPQASDLSMTGDLVSVFPANN